MEPNPYFKNTMKDINAVTPILEGVVNHALVFGVNPKGLNLSNAWSRCDRAIRELLDAELVAQELGYSSLGIALKALSQIKERGAYDVANLPVAFHKPPMVWLTGKPPSKQSEGFAPLRPRDAERQHRVILPLLLEAWELAKDDEAAKAQIEAGYRNWSAREFETELYTFIYDLEEPTLEEQFAEQQAQSALKFEDWQVTNAKARAKKRTKEQG